MFFTLAFKAPSIAGGRCCFFFFLLLFLFLLRLKSEA